MVKTAHNLSDEDMAIYRATARRRAAAERERLHQRRQQARAVARQAATKLKAEFGARRVFLFGSMVAGAGHARSDIDLAVEGIAPGDFWRAWAALDTLGPAFEIDLVDIDATSPALRAEIEQKGEEL